MLPLNINRPSPHKRLAPLDRHSISPPKASNESSSNASRAVKNRLATIINIYNHHEHLPEDKLIEVFQQNYSLIDKIRDISNSKHKDSVHEKMRPSPQFVTNHCKLLKNQGGKIPSFDQNFSFDHGKMMFLEKIKYLSVSKRTGTTDIRKKTITLPEIRHPTPNMRQSPSYGEKGSTHSSPNKVLEHPKSRRVMSLNQKRNLNSSPEIINGRSLRIESGMENNSQCYYEQKKYICFYRNHKLRGKLFYVEIAQKEKGGLYIFGRDIKSTNLYVLRLSTERKEKLLTELNYSYEKLIENLDFKDHKLILKLDDAVTTENCNTLRTETETPEPIPSQSPILNPLLEPENSEEEEVEIPDKEDSKSEEKSMYSEEKFENVENNQSLHSEKVQAKDISKQEESERHNNDDIQSVQQNKYEDVSTEDQDYKDDFESLSSGELSKQKGSLKRNSHD